MNATDLSKKMNSDIGKAKDGGKDKYRRGQTTHTSSYNVDTTSKKDLIEMLKQLYVPKKSAEDIMKERLRQALLE